MAIVQLIAHKSQDKPCKSNASKLKTAHHAGGDQKQTLQTDILQMKHDNFAGACILMYF